MDQARITLLCVFLLLSTALLSCISSQPVRKIGKIVETDRLADGIYTGSYKGGLNYAKVEVTVREQKISKIEILEHDTWKGKRLKKLLSRE